MILFQERLRLLCPRHKRRGALAKCGFRCICEEVSAAFRMGLFATTPRPTKGQGEERKPE